MHEVTINEHHRQRGEYPADDSGPMRRFLDKRCGRAHRARRHLYSNMRITA